MCVCAVSVTLAVSSALLGAVDRTVPEAYTKRSCRVTEKRAELLSEGLFNTLLLSNCLKKAQHRRDKHKSPKTPTETPLNPPKGSPNLKSPEFIPLMFPLLKEMCKSEERREPRRTPGSQGTNEDLPAAMCFRNAEGDASRRTAAQSPF